MITAIVGAGGKTSKLHALKEQYLAEGKRVFVTTTTHMYYEPGTLTEDDPAPIIRQLEETGYAMAGAFMGKRIAALSEETFASVCPHADEVLVEADGAHHMAIKYPNATEPVIPIGTNRIIIVCGLHALGRPAKEVVFREELVYRCLDIDGDTIITPAHVQKLLREGYLKPLSEHYPEVQLQIHAANDGSLYQRAVAALLEADEDVTLIDPQWFEEKPCLFLCGGGHVSKAVADLAAQLDFRVQVMDPREEFCSEERFPYAEKLICAPFNQLTEYLVPNAFYAVITSGHGDDANCVSTILNSKYRYLGMIGSRRKVAHTFQTLQEAGYSQDAINTIHAPIGLNIGAVTPGEIAVSILAELIQTKNAGGGTASASAELLQSRLHGTLCIIIEKTGSAPRGVGSMMLVTENGQIDTIGGGSIEYQAAVDARTITAPEVRRYCLNLEEAQNLGMVCGGTNRILFLPV